MTIHTPGSVRRIQRKLDRQRLKAGKRHAEAQVVLGQMRAGQCLQLLFLRASVGSVWQLLPSGKQVHKPIAQIVIADPNVVACDEGLFPGAPPQTYRYVDSD
jgi:hypothetical protein